MNVLVSIDNVQSEQIALHKALRLITHQGTVFTLLVVEEPIAPAMVSDIPGAFGSEAIVDMQYQVEIAHMEDARASSALDQAVNVCQQSGVQTVTRLEFGDPKHTICQVAKEINCDLIVVGSHGYGVVERVLLGSVSDYVVHHARCPVLVVRDDNSSEKNPS
ncbi:MAG: universal stress protein [Leptolyngbya sp. LCM1.Bin17]|nr:MAG: universal stress protein [Leptolyngbya sp. LCM1.Bin17]